MIVSGVWLRSPELLPDALPEVWLELESSDVLPQPLEQVTHSNQESIIPNICFSLFSEKKFGRIESWSFYERIQLESVTLLSLAICEGCVLENYWNLECQNQQQSINLDKCIFPSLFAVFPCFLGQKNSQIYEYQEC